MKSITEILQVARTTEGELLQSDRAEGPHGLRIPNSTQMPNEVLDNYIADLNEAELKVLLYLVRKTFGYNKVMGDAIALSQFMNGTKRKDGTIQDRGTGLSKTSILQALGTLEKIGFVEITKKSKEDGSKDTSFYRLKIEEITR